MYLNGLSTFSTKSWQAIQSIFPFWRREIYLYLGIDDVTIRSIKVSFKLHNTHVKYFLKKKL